MQEQLTGEWVSLGEAAKRLGLAVDTVRRRLKRGELQGRQRPTQQGYRWEVYLDGGYASVKAVEAPPTPHLDELVTLVRDLTQQNIQLAGQVGFLQAQLQQAQQENLALKAPAVEPFSPDDETISPAEPRRNWWQFWKRE